MNLSGLRTFLMIVETGNLNRAAERLNVGQSTVTARLNALEDELGQVLFARRKSGAVLTSAGFKFQRYAQAMTDMWRQAQLETSLPPEIEAVFNFGCHIDLWPQLGRPLFDTVRNGAAKVAVSAWPGEQAELDRWLSSGLVDAALCYSPSLRETWTARPLVDDRLILVSTTPRGLMRSDPAYVYVDCGEDFRRAHAAAYPYADAATTVFGCALWGLEHILAHGGSAYLPERLARAPMRAGRLHAVPGAPQFQRTGFLVVNKVAATQWPWLEAALRKVERTV